MRKRIIISYLIVFFICFPIKVHADKPLNDAKKGIEYKYTPSEGSVEEMYKDIIVTLLEPYITNEVEKHYGQLLQYDLFDVEFLKIDRLEYRSFSFIIKLQIRPFVGAHNTIGIDNITMKVSPIKTEVCKFEHIKSFQIPPHLKEHYKDLKL